MTMRVHGPNGVTVNFPDGTDSETVNRVMTEAVGRAAGNAGQAPDPSWSDLPGNVVPSAVNVAQGLWQAVSHPVQTVNNLNDAAMGGIERLKPQWLSDLHKRLPWAPSQATFDRQAQTSKAMGHALRDRYGSPAAWKRTMIEDPAGALLDVSTAATGAGALLSKAPMAASLSRGLLTVGRMTDPIAMTGNALRKTGEGVGLLASYPLSATTGATSEAIQQGYKAGLLGGEQGTAFRANMRGQEDAGAIVNEARDALDSIAEQRRASYLDNMQGTYASTIQVDPTPIQATLDDLRQSLYVQPKGQAGGNQAAYGQLAKGTPEEFAALDEIQSLLNEWVAHPEGLSPASLDALKQRISRMQPSPTAQNAGNLRRLVTAAENAVKDAIVREVPEYGKAMADYAQSKAMTNEIEKSLSLGRTASVDTTAAKLKAALGGSRKTRQANLKALEDNGARNIQSRIAGQQLSEVMPRGLLGRAIGTLIGGAGYLNPTALAMLPLTSPRLIGEASHLLGRTARKAQTHYSRKALLPALLGRDLEQQP